MTESHLDSLLSNTSATFDLLNSLSASFNSVEAQTTAFQAQCEGLMSEQRRLSKLADDIGGNLQYYNFLEPISRRMNAPGAGGFVRAKEYSEMLRTLDRCLEYMGSHVQSTYHINCQTTS
jgi:conserved oligomeric Golgi complex subunit 3